MAEEQFVVVMDTEDEVQALLYRRMLEEAGIAVFEIPLETDLLEGVREQGLHSQLMVSAKDAPEAERLIASFEQEADSGELSATIPDEYDRGNPARRGVRNLMYMRFAVAPWACLLLLVLLASAFPAAAAEQAKDAGTVVTYLQWSPSALYIACRVDGNKLVGDQTTLAGATLAGRRYRHLCELSSRTAPTCWIKTACAL